MHVAAARRAERRHRRRPGPRPPGPPARRSRTAARGPGGRCTSTPTPAAAASRSTSPSRASSSVMSTGSAAVMARLSRGRATAAERRTGALGRRPRVARTCGRGRLARGPRRGGPLARGDSQGPKVQTWGDRAWTRPARGIAGSSGRTAPWVRLSHVTWRVGCAAAWTTTGLTAPSSIVECARAGYRTRHACADQLDRARNGGTAPAAGPREQTGRVTTMPETEAGDAAPPATAADRPPRGSSRRVLRPRQDDHRQVERAGLQPAVLRRWAHQPPPRAAQRLRAVRVPGRRRRPRPDGEDARVPLQDGHRLARRHRARDRRRHAAQHRRPAGLRRGRLAHRGAPPGRPRRHHRLGVRARRWSSRSGSCSASTPSSPPSCRSTRTAGTPARSTSTPTPRTRRPRSRSSPSAAATTSSRSYAYSDSITDVHMLEIVGHPHAVNPDKELRRVAREQAVAGAGLRPPGRARRADAAARAPERPGRPRGGYGGRGRWRHLPRRATAHRAARRQVPPRPIRGDPGSPCPRRPAGVQRETTTQDPHTSQAPTR